MTEAPKTPTETSDFEILLVTLPGLEPYLYAEACEQGFRKPKTISGGVIIRGHWKDVWRANLVLRGASKVLARIGEFRALHLAQLDKRARLFPWDKFFTPGHSIKVDVSTNRGSQTYHAGAAEQRIETAIEQSIGAKIAQSTETADIIIKARIEKNLVILSIDTSGTALHKRGHKQAMGKAPLRETIAAMTLRACGYKRTLPLLDPMCGSGTYVIEAAEIAANKMAGRDRRFAFENLVSYNADAVNSFKDGWHTRQAPAHFYGSDRNSQVIDFAKDNARRAGVGAACRFEHKPLSDISCPDGPSGLIIVNPPFGIRIGDKRELLALHQSFGKIMRERFKGWRAAMITTDKALAEATNLRWKPASAPIPHGGLKIRLYQTGEL